jgi:hypothetical protein
MMRTVLLLALVLFTSGVDVSAQPAAGTPQSQSERQALIPERQTTLFNGRDLSGWKADVPAKDKDPGA